MSFSLSAQTYNFEYYNVEEGLSQSRVTSIMQDDRGYLWVGTHGGGLCKFDGVDFVKYSEKNGLSGNIVTLLGEVFQNIMEEHFLTIQPKTVYWMIKTTLFLLILKITFG